MALQASGSISAKNIRDEFGQTTNISFGAYRVSQTVGSLANLPLDTGIPQSGSISFSDFYSKRLNIVVDFHSGGTVTRQTARTRYNNSNVTVIGGFKTRPSSGAGSRVIINVNKNIGSAQGNINNVALRTGSWESNTNLEMQIGSSGKLFGAGGNGGAAGSAGANGTSALGIEYSPIIVTNRGYIQSGGGGGGGSSSYGVNERRKKSWGRRSRRPNTVPGKAGGGGSGLPGGSGGGGNATAGTLTAGGAGGTGTHTFEYSYAARSGAAGGSNGANGGSKDGNAGGSQGRAIIIFNSGTGVSITSTGGGSVSGPTVNNTNPT
jgi:hypothetical protein